MKQIKNNTKVNKHQKRLQEIGNMLFEIRFSEGKNQEDYAEFSITRRQIQRGEYGSNLTLISLFNLLDCYGYELHEFFQDLQ
jgi:transcriptional regulator with XRE-family HTH domain